MMLSLLRRSDLVFGPLALTTEDVMADLDPGWLLPAPRHGSAVGDPR